jgi:signal transduction histidine kinase
VEAGGRSALTELRRLLGLLAEEPGEADLAPQPGLAQLDALVERVRSAGLPVELEVAGSPRPLPAGLDLAAYRIVQEALTNALRHAGGAPTRAVVDYRADELRLEVVNEAGRATAPGAGAGRGLPGMRERAAVYGGRLEAGPRPAGGFGVSASLPLDGR